MKPGRRSLDRWLSEAWPIVRSLMEAEDRLISTSEAPAVVVLAACDQLAATMAHAQRWLGSRRCPDDNFGLQFRELIAACQGLCAIMQRVTREAPEGRWVDNQELADRIGEDFMDRIQQASRARLYLQQWST
jgi:hypothetical protein